MAGVSWVLSQWDRQDGCSSPATSSDCLVNFQGAPSVRQSLLTPLRRSPQQVREQLCQQPRGQLWWGQQGHEQGGHVRDGCSEAPSSCLHHLYRAVWCTEISPPWLVSEGSRCAADHPSGVICLGTHAQGGSETGVSNNSLKVCHVPLCYTGSLCCGPGSDYITAQAGDAITLWLNCIPTITRHRGEERLPGKHRA